MSYIKDELKEAIGKKWTKRLTGIAVVILVYAGISFFGGIWPFSSAVGVAQRVSNPDRIIQSYEWFYDAYHSIQAQVRNVAILPEGSTERIGGEMVLNRRVEEYNSRARQITRNLWMANDLPQQIILEELK